jgi:hypothetical protein
MSGGFLPGQGGHLYPTVSGGGGGGGITAVQAAVAVMGMLSGDHGDGDVTISGTTTLTRDMYYDDLTVANGGTLVTAQWRVFARTVTVEAGGDINCNGAAATGTGASTNFSAGSFAASIAGGAGGTAAGTGPSAVTTGTIRSNPLTGAGMSASGAAVANVAGQGGGGGGGSGAAAGGGGGGGGGILYIQAGSVVNNGTIRAHGGAGAAGPGADRGGGGGGGGGVVYIVCGSFTGNVPTVTGGAAGAGGGGSGVAGAAGNDGQVYILEAA